MGQNATRVLSRRLPDGVGDGASATAKRSYARLESRIAMQMGMRRFAFQTWATFDVEVHVPSGLLYQACRTDLLRAVGLAIEQRDRWRAALPSSRVRAHVRYPNGDRVPSSDMAAAVRTVRVLAGQIPRRGLA